MLIEHQVIKLDMPTKTKEAVTENEDGSYTIFINAKLNHEPQMTAYIHAMRHILGNDFQKDDVQSIEYWTHKTD